MIAALYRQSLALHTDLYQLTMAQGYWKTGTADKEAVFHLTFRENPFEGGFTVAAGLACAVEYVKAFEFTADDLAYLWTLKGNDEKPLFERAFLDHLRDLKLRCDIDAIAEGTVVFPNEPMVRVQGSILEAQLLETPLLNLINFQTLVATKSARICLSAKGQPVYEFGLRRAQGIDGAISASRAAYVGGCAGTSNVLAGKLFGIPVKGTHAHSWVMAFGDEREAMLEYAKAMPNNCVFLVDTYNTLAGVRNAVEVGRWLQSHGHKMTGIRLDSGDLAYLSIEARKILDESGFKDAAILASNDLDEHIIASLKDQGAQITVWGVGTRLATAYDQPALGGVYKLSAIREKGAPWKYKVKLSEQTAKISTPGILGVRRFSDGKHFVADAIYDLEMGIAPESTIIDPIDITKRKTIPNHLTHEDLLEPIFRNGELVTKMPTLEESRARTLRQLSMFHPAIERFVNPHRYPVGLEKKLHELRTDLILQARGTNP